MFDKVKAQVASTVASTPTGPSNVTVGADVLSRSFYCVEEPIVMGHAIPNDIAKASTQGKASGSPIPAAAKVNLFGTFEEAAIYAKKLNRNLLVMELKPYAKVEPQEALVTPVNNT